MFTCNNCQQTVPAKVKPVMVITGTRNVAYSNIVVRLDEYEREHKEEVNSVGTEITSMGKYCPSCVEMPLTEPIAPMLMRGVSFEEKLAPQLRVPMIGFIVDSALARVVQSSKRAAADATVAVPLIKEFTNNNPKFVF